MGEAAETAKRYDEAFNAQDATARAALRAPDVEVVMSGGLRLEGQEHAAQLERGYWEALPDGRLRETARLDARDTAVTEGVMTGTHTGTLRTPAGDVPPSGRPIELSYCAVHRVRDGLIVSEHLYIDRLELLEQIGADGG